MLSIRSVFIHLSSFLSILMHHLALAQQKLKCDYDDQVEKIDSYNFFLPHLSESWCI